MCEPFHSINQFEDHGPSANALQRVLGPIKNLGTRIRGWLHFSKVGAGHSEGLAKISGNSDLCYYGTQYETAWWNRQTHLDGIYRGELASADALIAAEQYAMRSSIGHIQILRRFLEPTLKTTDRGYGYFAVFRNMLTSKGKDILERKTIQVVGAEEYRKMSMYAWHSSSTLGTSLINAMMGITRKRELLIPEWADDDKLWLPASSKGSVILPANA